MKQDSRSLTNTELAAPPSPPAASSIFYPHGIWAPGVKLMRNLNFGAKAILISLMFLLPLALTSYLSLSSLGSNIRFAQDEIQGVEALQQFSPVLQGLNTLRGAMRAKMGGYAGADASFEAGRRQMDTGLKDFDAHLKRTGDPLELRAEFDQLAGAWSKAAPTTQTTGDTGYGEVSRTVTPLLRKIGDKSSLVLDPDIDSLYLVLTLVIEAPKLIEDLDQMWGWSVNALASAQLEERNARRYVVWQANVLSSLNSMRDSMQRAGAANPALTAKLPTAQLTALEAYHKQFQNPDQLMAANLPPAQAYASGEQALKEAFTLYNVGLSELDRLLMAREAFLSTERNLVAALIAVSVLLASYFFYSFFLVTRGGLRLISRHLQDMSAGDLRQAPSQPWGKDEPALVIVDLRKTYDALHHLIRRVRHSARELNITAKEIASASTDLSARTEAAAASLEEQAAAMEEIGSTVGATADRAKSASLFSGENAQVAEKGGAVIGQVVHTMRDIHASSSKIGDIIGVIDGIAFQTNILALNAAVEAARAGEAGRGFAVVAAEVRTLAQRSAEAAREIKNLITESVSKVDSGTQVVEEAGSTMVSVVTNAKQINIYLTEIATASREQASGVGQVVQAIQALDHDTQQNSALVEETTAAAEALRSQADLLMQEISNFRVA
ncbi:MAG: methyl-accepting chemotaxis protein [Hylemonella sp.]|nr:methyl-accepting chemotaxis protein [Hylemonella sp.]